MADAQVLQVPEGSVIVLRGVHLDGDFMERFVPEIATAVGHKRFVILEFGDEGQAAVMDADEVIALIQEAVKPKQED